MPIIFHRSVQISYPFQVKFKLFIIFVILVKKRVKNQIVSITRKNIKVLIVWLVGLMITAHEIVPHHHHYDSIYSHEVNDTGTPVHGEHEKQQDSSKHCHAFNESIVNWVDYNRISFQPLNQLLDIISISPEILEPFNNGYFEYRFICDISPFIHFVIYESPLRAPPALA